MTRDELREKYKLQIREITDTWFELRIPRVDESQLKIDGELNSSQMKKIVVILDKIDEEKKSIE
jgi:hypothetical protein